MRRRVVVVDHLPEGRGVVHLGAFKFVDVRRLADHAVRGLPDRRARARAYHPSRMDAALSDPEKARAARSISPFPGLQREAQESTSRAKFLDHDEEKQHRHNEPT